MFPHSLCSAVRHTCNMCDVFLSNSHVQIINAQLECLSKYFKFHNFSFFKLLHDNINLNRTGLTITVPGRQVEIKTYFFLCKTSLNSTRPILISSHHTHPVSPPLVGHMFFLFRSVALNNRSLLKSRGNQRIPDEIKPCF